MRRIASLIFVLIILAAWACPAFAWANSEAYPTDSPTWRPTEAPDDEPTETATLSPSPEPTEAPAPEPTPEPTETPTPRPTDDPSGIDVTICTLTGADVRAAGYIVQMDKVRLTADAVGIVEFPGVNPGAHDILITDPEGQQSLGRLYISRGPETALSPQAMGGTYGLSVPNGQDEVYLVVTFVAGQGMYVQSATDYPPNIPVVTPTPEPTEPPTPEPTEAPTTAPTTYPSKTVHMQFLDADGKPIAGLDIRSALVDQLLPQMQTDNEGNAVMPDVQFATYTFTAEQLMATFTLTITPGTSVFASGSESPNFTVAVPERGRELYLEFEWGNNRLTLVEASDQPIEHGAGNGLIIGIIVAACAAAGIIIAAVLVRRKKNQEEAAKTRSTTRPYTASTVSTADEDPSIREAGIPRLVGTSSSKGKGDGTAATSGPNKYDDRSDV